MSKYPELDKYIAQARQKGVSDATLRQEMVKSGYNAVDIAEVMGSPSSSNSTNSGKNKILKIIAILIVAALFGVLGYLYIPKVMSSAPYQENNFLAGFVSKIDEIDSASYSASLSFYGEPKDPDAKPFEINREARENFAKKFKRDQERFSYINSFVSNFKYSDKVLPEKLTRKEPEFVGNSPIDPLTKKIYDYSLVENGEDFNLVVSFETEDAVASIEEMSALYLDDDAMKDSIKIDGQTVTFTKNSPRIYIKQKSVTQNIFESFDEYSSYIPPDINTKIAFSIENNPRELGELIDIQSNFLADVDLGDFAYKVDVDFIKKAENIYIKLNNFPSILTSFTGVNPPKEKWIKINLAENPMFSDNSFESLVPEDEKDKIIDFLINAVRIADSNVLFKFVEEPVKEKINDETVYKYSLQINQDSLPRFFDDLMEEMKKPKYEPMFTYDIREIDDLINKIQDEEFKTAIEYYINNTEHNIWFNKKGYPVKFGYSLRLVPDPEIAKNIEDTQFISKFELLVSDINKPVEIVEPEEWIDFEEVISSLGFDSMYGPSGITDLDVNTKGNLVPARVHAELVYDEVGGYGTKPFSVGPCLNDPETLFANEDVFQAILNSTDESSIKATCASEITDGVVDKYAISVPLSDGSYFCIDSESSAIEIGEKITKASCE